MWVSGLMLALATALAYYAKQPIYIVKSVSLRLECMPNGEQPTLYIVRTRNTVRTLLTLYDLL